MIKKLVLAVAMGVLALPALAGNSQYEYRNYGSYGGGGGVIVVSCYRGPWKEVIWDRPNAVFIDSLVDVGYDYSTAAAIGERICRDQNLVGNPGALRASMQNIVRGQGYSAYNY
jgi:hypothetical protein